MYAGNHGKPHNITCNTLHQGACNIAIPLYLSGLSNVIIAPYGACFHLSMAHFGTHCITKGNHRWYVYVHRGESTREREGDVVCPQIRPQNRLDAREGEEMKIGWRHEAIGRSGCGHANAQIEDMRVARFRRGGCAIGTRRGAVVGGTGPRLEISNRALPTDAEAERRGGRGLGRSGRG